MIKLIKKGVFLTIVAFGMLVAATTSAQSKYYSGNISYEVKDIQQYGNIVNVKVRFALTDFKVKTLKSIDFTPVISDGVNSIPLPSIAFKGRNNFITYGRTLDLLSKDGVFEYNKKYPKYTVINQSVAKTEEVIYEFSLPFENWMANAHVNILKHLNCCGKETFLERSQIAESVNLEKEIKLYEPVIFVSYIEPKIEVIKQRSTTIESSVEFQVGAWFLNPSFRENQAKLNKLNDQINDIVKDVYTTITSVVVAGYSSPEGNSKQNSALSMSRINSILKYIEKRVSIPAKLFKLNNVGEAWADLRKIIYDSKYDFRIDLLRIIDSESNFALRNRQIAHLNNGTTYRFLLDSIYPKLRKVVLNIEFDVESFDVNVAREIIKIVPINLSLNEMFQVANSYGIGSDESNEVFLTARRAFPEEAVSRINAASVRLLRGELSIAEDYLYGLSPTEEYAEFYNVNGIISMMNGLYDEAEEYFNTAKSMGLEAAEHNLKELRLIYMAIDEQELQRQRFSETQIIP